MQLETHPEPLTTFIDLALPGVVTVSDYDHEKVLSIADCTDLTPTSPNVSVLSGSTNYIRDTFSDIIKLENKRRQFLFCCHMLSGNGQARPYLE